MKPLNVFFFQKMTDEAVIYTEKEQKTIKQNQVETRPRKCEQKTTSNFRVKRNIKINKA